MNGEAVSNHSELIKAHVRTAWADVHSPALLHDLRPPPPQCSAGNSQLLGSHLYRAPCIDSTPRFDKYSQVLICIKLQVLTPHHDLTNIVRTITCSLSHRAANTSTGPRISVSLLIGRIWQYSQNDYLLPPTSWGHYLHRASDICEPIDRNHSGSHHLCPTARKLGEHQTCSSRQDRRREMVCKVRVSW